VKKEGKDKPDYDVQAYCGNHPCVGFFTRGRRGYKYHGVVYRAPGSQGTYNRFSLSMAVSAWLSRPATEGGAGIPAAVVSESSREFFDDRFFQKMIPHKLTVLQVAMLYVLRRCEIKKSRNDGWSWGWGEANPFNPEVSFTEEVRVTVERGDKCDKCGEFATLDLHRHDGSPDSPAPDFVLGGSIFFRIAMSPQVFVELAASDLAAVPSFIGMCDPTMDGQKAALAAQTALKQIKA